jgi:hypothetical protein
MYIQIYVWLWDLLEAIAVQTGVDETCANHRKLR